MNDSGGTLPKEVHLDALGRCKSGPRMPYGAAAGGGRARHVSNIDYAVAEAQLRRTFTTVPVNWKREKQGWFIDFATRATEDAIS